MAWMAPIHQLVTSHGLSVWRGVLVCSSASSSDSHWWWWWQWWHWWCGPTPSCCLWWHWRCWLASDACREWCSCMLSLYNTHQHPSLSDDAVLVHSQLSPCVCLSVTKWCSTDSLLLCIDYMVWQYSICVIMSLLSVQMHRSHWFLAWMLLLSDLAPCCKEIRDLQLSTEFFPKFVDLRIVLSTLLDKRGCLLRSNESSSIS